ncbi:hypothetical protein RND71_009747 [Anisodus tanguticus]|uniref:Uncharacterized protein n=1 Tax=Anisodus tanguticus TaxID=243964 RepID=A0AAE1SIC3_9SOLA|nr:hypothetical protein RND71_009747 [Anisodus tanguticus]
MMIGVGVDLISGMHDLILLLSWTSLHFSCFVCKFRTASLPFLFCLLFCLIKHLESILGLVLFVVAKSTTRGFPTTHSSENIASLAKKLGGSSGKLIQATATDVSSEGLTMDSILKASSDHILSVL